MRSLRFLILVAILAVPAACQSIITTFAGTDWILPVDGRPALQSPLGRVNSVAVDRDGRVVFSDPTSHMVLRAGSDGKIDVVAGNGIQTYSGDGGPGSSASLWTPLGVATDADGNTYIADGFNYRIRKVNPSGVITTVLGSGLRRTNGGTSFADIGFSPLVAVDSGHTIYVYESDSHRILSVSASGQVAVFAGGGCAIDPAPSCDISQRRHAEGVRPTTLCLGNVNGLAVDAANVLYIADSTTRQVIKIEQGVVHLVAGGGTLGQFGDNIAAASADLAAPAGLTVDRQGVLYIAEAGNARVRRVRNGQIDTYAGDRVIGFRDAPRAQALFRAPVSVAADLNGNVFVADQENFRIRQISPTDVSTVAGNGNPYNFTDGVPAINAFLNMPNGLGIDRTGNLLVGDTANGLVRRVTNGGMFTVAGSGFLGSGAEGTRATATPLVGPRKPVVDSNNNLYFSDAENHVVRKVSPDGLITTVAGVPGACGLGGENVSPNSLLKYPGEIALDDLGNLYIAEYFNHRIRKLSLSTGGTISTFAGSLTGQNGFSGDNGPAQRALLNYPYGLAVDSNRNVYVSDGSNRRIRRIDSSGIITTIAGGGSQNPRGANVVATSAALSLPAGLAVDSANNLYFADQLLNGVFRISSGLLTPVAGGGPAGLSGDGGTAVQALLRNPVGVGVDAAGNVYVADTSNNRVRQVRSIAPDFAAAPAKLTFRAKRNGSGTETQSVQLSPGLSGMRWSAKASAPWMKLSDDSGVMPATLLVSADPTGLAAGTLSGTIAITSPGARTPQRTIAVDFTVDPEDPPVIDVDSAPLNFSFNPGDAPVTTTIGVRNIGSGSLAYLAAASTADGGGWLTVSAQSRKAAANSPSSVQVTTDPGSLDSGTYTGVVRITSTDVPTVVEIPVAITVVKPVPKAEPTEPVQTIPRIVISNTTMNFTAVEGGSAPLGQNVAVLNVGTGTLNYSVDFQSLPDGSQWLQASSLGGSSVAGGGQTFAQVGVAVNPAGLTPGTYSGRFRVIDPNAINSPQLVTVYLNVLPAGKSPGPDVAPGGLVFIGDAGSNPGSQKVAIANLQKSSISYEVVKDQDWLTVAPTQGVVDGGATDLRMAIQANFGQLAAGVYRSTVILRFSDGNSRNINVLGVVGGSTTSPNKDAQRETSATSCKPGVQVTSPTSGSSVIAAQTFAISATITGCTLSSPLISYVINGTPQTINLTQAAGGWSSNAAASRPAGTQMSLSFRSSGFQGSTFLISDAVVVNLNVIAPPVPATPPPVIKILGNAATLQERSLVAPGSVVTIFGESLSDNTVSTDLVNLPLEIDGTSVEVAGKPVPLTAVQSNQINAIIPFEIKSAVQQIQVRRKNLYSPPAEVSVAPSEPGILTVNQQGTGPGFIYRTSPDGSVILVGSATPARAGDVLLIRCTGLGDVSPPVPAGTPGPADIPAVPVNPVKVTIADQQADVVSQILSPLITGQYEVRVVVPPGLPSGDAVVRLFTGGLSSPPVVTVAIQ